MVDITTQVINQNFENPNGRKYARLNPEHSEIRLVTILPGNDGSQIHCTMENVSLMRSPKYTALSYCWGDPDDTVEIVVDDQTFRATTNLHAALSRLRDTEYTTLWIDAICINQEDVVERSQQLLLMGSIYRKATKTVAWLGDLTHSSSHPMFQKKVGSRTPANEIDGLRIAIQVGDMIRNSYWRRVWIIQELALSQDILLVWSEASLEFSKFESNFKDLSIEYASGILNPSDRWHVQQILRFRSDMVDEQPLSFLEALGRSHMSLATDIRDKAFALINMTYNGNTYIPIPNYSQDPGDLRLDLTKAALKATKSVDILVLLANPGHTSSPSWVPDWLSMNAKGGSLQHKIDYALRKMSWPTRVQFGKQYISQSRMATSFRSLSTSDLPPSIYGSTIRVGGGIFPFGTLSWLTSDINAHMKCSNPPQSGTRIPTSYITRYTDEPPLSDYGDILLQRLFFTLSILGARTGTSRTDTSSDDYERSPHIDTFRSWQASVVGKNDRGDRALIAWLKGNENLPLWGHTLGHWLTCQEVGGLKNLGKKLQEVLGRPLSRGDKDPERISRNIKESLNWGLRLAMTESGHIGWVTPQAQVGDHITFLDGCTSLAVLRKRQAGGWTMVGWSFVHGYSDNARNNKRPELSREFEIY